MIARLRGAWSALFAPHRSRGRSGGEEVIAGVTGNVIIVKSPNTEYFKEAIFILCDDPLTRRGADREQLLREARSAARDYVAARTPARSTAALTHLLCFLLGAIVSCALLLLFGV